ncbi:hypothetical protein ABEW06_09730, partial [Peribacillus simplex]
FYFKTKLIGTEGARLLREKRVKGRPRRLKAEEAPLTARGKRVPGVEINVQICTSHKVDKLDFPRVCLLQSEVIKYIFSYLLGEFFSKYISHYKYKCFLKIFIIS